MKSAFRNFTTLLSRNNYKLDRIKGSHYIYTNGKNTIAVNIDLNPMVGKRLIKEYALS